MPDVKLYIGPDISYIHGTFEDGAVPSLTGNGGEAGVLFRPAWNHWNLDAEPIVSWTRFLEKEESGEAPGRDNRRLTAGGLRLGANFAVFHQRLNFGLSTTGLVGGNSCEAIDKSADEVPTDSTGEFFLESDSESPGGCVHADGLASQVIPGAEALVRGGGRVEVNPWHGLTLYFEGGVEGSTVKLRDPDSEEFHLVANSDPNGYLKTGAQWLFGKRGGRRPRLPDCLDCEATPGSLFARASDEARRWKEEMFEADGTTLKADVREALAGLGIPDAILNILGIATKALPTYGGLEGISPQDITYQAGITARIGGGGVFELWDKLPLKHGAALTLLTWPRLKEWIEANHRSVTISEARAAVEEAYRPDAFQFYVGRPSTVLREQAERKPDLASFEAYLASQNIFKDQSAFNQAKTIITQTAERLRNPALAEVRFKLHGTASTDGSASKNLTLSDDRAKLIKKWFELSGVATVETAFGTGEEIASLTCQTGGPDDPDTRKGKEPTPECRNQNRAVKIEWLTTGGELVIRSPGEPERTIQLNPIVFDERATFGEASVRKENNPTPDQPCPVLVIGEHFIDKSGAPATYVNAHGATNPLTVGETRKDDCTCDMAPEVADPR